MATRWHMGDQDTLVMRLDRLLAMPVHADLINRRGNVMDRIANRRAPGLTEPFHFVSFRALYVASIHLRM